MRVGGRGRPGAAQPFQTVPVSASLNLATLPGTIAPRRSSRSTPWRSTLLRPAQVHRAVSGGRAVCAAGRFAGLRRFARLRGFCPAARLRPAGWLRVAGRFARLRCSHGWRLCPAARFRSAGWLRVAARFAWLAALPGCAAFARLRRLASLPRRSVRPRRHPLPWRRAAPCRSMAVPLARRFAGAPRHWAAAADRRPVLPAARPPHWPPRRRGPAGLSACRASSGVPPSRLAARPGRETK